MIPVTGVLSVLENRPLTWWDAQIVGGDPGFFLGLADRGVDGTFV